MNGDVPNVDDAMTERSEIGEVVPIPTFPPPMIVIPFVLSVETFGSPVETKSESAVLPPEEIYAPRSAAAAPAPVFAPKNILLVEFPKRITFQ